MGHAQINTGPDERETNLKLVYEQVYRSIQRSTEEASKIRHEIQELDSFCQKGYIPPIYDAYNCSQQDIEKMKELQTSTPAKDSQPSNSPVPQVIQIPQLQLSGIQARRPRQLVKPLVALARSYQEFWKGLEEVPPT
ncbi:unnamed protein product [Effrenium voratum]|uniref:Uncharacterized protein n=1 Tax=Effrenium voratum TaxID=2562239 RepID=A0AA36IG12_9DINO|nr:unnamed protein product [Effrenium voratum]